MSSQRVLMTLVSLFGLMACGSEDDGTGADESEGFATTEAPEVKYAEEPVDPLDLDIAAGAELRGRLSVDLARGEFRAFVFQKQAGKRYTVGLTGLTGDLDLFGHYVRDVSRRNHQFVSWRYGTAEEQFDFTATEDGPYYVLVHGYEAGRASLELYVGEAAAASDEVQWPVQWGADNKTTREMVGGGLAFLQVHNYGPGCGNTPHPGYDLNFGGGSADLGLPVFAVADGEVIESYYASWGNLILVEHRLASGLEFWSLYGHLQRRDVEAGDRVRRGQTIGTIGATGTISPHLHFELRRSRFPASRFPCSNSEWQIRSNYYDPGEFIRGH